MTAKDFVRKITSRKFWVALAGFISGLVVAFGGDEGTASTVSGIILQGASVIGYLLAEGLTDAAAAATVHAPTEPASTEKGNT